MSAFSSSSKAPKVGVSQLCEDKQLNAKLDALEDEDEFEEFDCKDWKLMPALADDELWESNWDNEVQEDQFIQQLRAELKKDQPSE